MTRNKLSFLMAGALLFGFTASTYAATWYVDGQATAGTNKGTSWANAWTSFGAISGVMAGDTVYISGGPSGTSQTYPTGTPWGVPMGSGGVRITYQIGQDPAHNGTAIFSKSGAGWGWVNSCHDLVVSGDAGDGKMHFALSGYGAILDASGSPVENVHISYMNWGQVPGAGSGGAGNVSGNAKKVEIDHCYCYVTNVPMTDHFMFLGSYGTTWDDGSNVHHCEFWIPVWQADGRGMDGIQNHGVGTTLHDNFIGTYDVGSTYLGGQADTGQGQHADGWQAWPGTSYTKVYNNIMYGFPSYGLYPSVNEGTVISHLRIYNNIVLANPSRDNGNIVVGVDGGVLHATIDDVLIANNISVNETTIGSPGAMCLENPNQGGDPSIFSNSLISNNILVGAKANYIGMRGNPNTPVRNTAIVNGADVWVSYAPGSANCNFHLLPTATALIGQGENLSRYKDDFPEIMFDLDGNPRPSGSAAWDIGPFEYGSSSSPVNGHCGLSVNSCSAGIFSDVQDSDTQYLWRCAGLNGGSTADCHLDKSTIPNAINGSTFPVTLDSPFVFNILNPGEYKIMGTLTTTNGGTNSVYIDIDHDPNGDDTRAWDMSYPLNQSSQESAWRGTLNSSAQCQQDPTQNCDQYNPKTWNLSVGTHTLFIDTREQGTIISKIQFVLISNPTPTPTPTPSTSTTPTPTPTPSPPTTPTPTPPVNPTPTPDAQIEGFTPFKNVFNPTKDSINITYTVAGTVEVVTMSVYDRQGNKVKELAPANGTATWNGRNTDGQTVAAGTYILILKEGNKIFKRKVVAIK